MSQPAAIPFVKDEAVILTTYLTGMPDPQRADKVPVDEISRMQVVPGAARLGLHVVVFHDQLSDEFVDRFSHSKLEFVRVPTDTTRSVNDQRFFLYRRWLAKNPRRSVFCSDGFDVRINRDPHALIDDQFQLWVGIHRSWTIDDSTADGRWVAQMTRHCYGEVPIEVYSKPILMAGTWGGRYVHVLRTLILLCDEIDDIHSRRPGMNCNLAAFNRVVYRDIGASHVWMKGAPLHSVFRKFEYTADVCFVHK